MIKAEIISHQDYEENWKSMILASSKALYYLVIYTQEEILLIYPVIDKKDPNLFFRAFEASAPLTKIKIIKESEKEVYLPSPYSVSTSSPEWLEFFSSPKEKTIIRQSLSDDLFNSLSQYTLNYSSFIFSSEFNSPLSQVGNHYLIIAAYQSGFSFAEIKIEKKLSEYHYYFSIKKSLYKEKNQIKEKDYPLYKIKEISSLFR